MGENPEAFFVPLKPRLDGLGEDERWEWPAAPVTSPSTGVAPGRQVSGCCWCCCTAAVQTPELTGVSAKLCRGLAETGTGGGGGCRLFVWPEEGNMMHGDAMKGL